MKILFAYTNINGFHADGYGFGLAHIMSITREAGHEIKFEQIDNKEDYQKFTDTFQNFKPKVVGFTAVSSQWSFVAELSTLIKDLDPKVITVTGGVHPSLYPECLLETDKMDAVFIGDSEHSFIDFLNTIEKNESWKLCDNVAYAKNGKLIKNKMKKLLQNEELEKLPHPDREIYPFLKVMKVLGHAPFHFTRGCPFTCSYCSNIGLAKVYGQNRYNIRSASPEHCIQELEEVIKAFPEIGTKFPVSIEDDIFGINKKWRREFLTLYRERIKIPFMCLLRCDVVNEDFIKDLRRSNCYRIQFGLESGSDYIRNVVMDRKMEDSTIIYAFKLAHKYKIKTGALNVIGVPGETEEMLWETINMNRRVRASDNLFQSSCNIFYPYKGTPLGDRAFKENLVDIEKYLDFSNERRQSVLAYDQEWLDKLIYYHSNWTKLIRNDSFFTSSVKDFIKASKSIVKQIPIAGPAMTQFNRKYIYRGTLHNTNRAKN